MRPVILFRRGLCDAAELSAIRQSGFRAADRRSAVPRDCTVIGRYSVLPYYRELEEDLAAVGSALINTYAQHRWIADIGAWCEEFADDTPRTWLDFQSYAQSGFAGPVVLKGRTNSRKQRWGRDMFALNPDDARKVWLHLLDDDLIAEQGIVVREFEHFLYDGYDISGSPVTDEHRVFVLDGVPVVGGFYWSEHQDVVSAAFVQDTSEAVSYVREKIAPKLRARFVVADVARHRDGAWRLVELNDGQMSGLSCIDPVAFYAALAERFTDVP